MSCPNFCNSGRVLIREVFFSSIVKTRYYSKTFGSQTFCKSHRNMAKAAVSSQNFDNFLVLDFEATCDNERNPQPQEIIEFPVLKINSRTWKTDATFHTYVEPDVHKQISPFCTQLTGIIQDMVDHQPTLTQTLQLFDVWMQKENLLENSIFVTCGDWDLKTMLPKQCEYLDLKIPGYFKRWINIKRAFSDVTGIWPKGMMQMLSALNIRHQGRHHSGIDDCKNIAEILRELARRGLVLKQTGGLK